MKTNVITDTNDHPSDDRHFLNIEIVLLLILKKKLISYVKRNFLFSFLSVEYQKDPNYFYMSYWILFVISVSPI